MYKIFQKQYFSFIIFLILLLAGSFEASAAFTLEDEQKLGKEIYDKLQTNNFLLKDKKLNAYITDIGNRVLSQSQKAPFNFTFSIFNSSAINAFATPGGYIYINKGLITSVENEAQLAGVIAHEIAHANARHVASIIEKSQKLNIAMLAAIIAGAFLGGGGEATAAIAAFSIAGATSMSLKYQREHEEEADRMGIAYLVDAGYYPQAMVEFLKIIKQYDFFSKTIPSYLKTHPGTDDRIFYIDSLIQTDYRQPNGKKNIVGNFIRMQALVSRDTDDLKKRSRQLTEAARQNPQDVDLLYALAMTEDQLGHANIAIEKLNKAMLISPQDEDILRTLGMLYLKTGDAWKALPLLKNAEKIDPENEQIIFSLGKTYFALNDFINARDCFLKLEGKTVEDQDINYHIAMSYGRINNNGESHYYFGLYFKNEKKTESALFHFKKARDYFPEGSAKANAISEAIKELSSDKGKKPARKPAP